MQVTRFNFRREPQTEPLLINCVLDGSPSMHYVKDEMAQSLNEDFVGALNGIHKPDRKVTRVYSEVFATNMIPMWSHGFKALYEIGEQPFDVSVLKNGDELGGATALFASTLRAFGHLVTAGNTLGEQMSCRTRGRLIVLTDGNNNMEPLGDDGIEKVRQAFTYRQQRISVHKTLVYFKTGTGLDKLMFGRMAARCQFDSVFFFDEHPTDKTALRKAIRRAIALLSKPLVSAAKKKSTVTVRFEGEIPLEELLKW